MSNASRFVALAVLVTACGTPTQSETPANAESAKPATADDSPDRAEFMAQCAHEKEQEPFCSCSFDQAKQVLTPEEMGKSDLAPERAQALRRAIGRECTDKLPEKAVKAGFLAKCSAHGPPSMQKFCDCTWDTVRKSLSVKEMALLDRKDPRVNQAVESCHFPEADVEKLFLADCVKDPAIEKYCQCAWGTLRKAVTTTDLALGGMTRSESEEATKKVKSECRQFTPPAKQPAP